MKKIKTLLLFMILVCAFSFLASCNKEVEETPHEHTWSEWVVVVDPTCAAEGIKECHCTGCNEEKRESVDKLEHEYVQDKVLVEPTCSSHGVVINKCKHCGDIVEEEKAKIEHNIVDGVCTVCGNSAQETTKCTVTVNLNGGMADDLSGEYIFGDTIYLPNPDKDNCVFEGWYTTPDFKEDSKVDNAVSVKENLNIYAKWKFLGSNITLDAGEGFVLESQIVILLNEKLTIEVPKTTNYKFFEGWYLGEQQITKENGVLLKAWDLAEDVTLTAKWADEKVVNGVKYIYSGTYPQSVVTNENIINQLNSLTDVNESGYLVLNGLQYEKVTYTQGSYQAWFNDGTLLVDGNTYYFLVEPVLWCVIDAENCAAITSKIIDVRQYALSDTVNNIKPSVSPNNYEYSDVNNWLNADGDYLDVNFAFKICGSADEVVKNIIFTVGLDNSLSSTKDTSNPYVCSNFTSYFHLLSCAEYVDSYKDILSSTKATDYAICKGVLVDHYTMNAEWWLRTPCAEGAGLAKYVTCTGDVAYTKVTNNKLGIRPVASFKSLAVLGGESDE